MKRAIVTQLIDKNELRPKLKKTWKSVAKEESD